MNRREFIKTSAAGIGGIILVPACIYDKKPYRFFTEAEADCVIALTDQIIPEDEFGPGAVYANVINYIDKQLTEVFEHDRMSYRTGIRLLEISCKELFGKRFKEIDFSSQTEILKALEKDIFNKEKWIEIKGSDFLSLVIGHTMQGFYGSPRHGGNKNYISYRLMELEYPLVIGQNRYREEDG